VKHLLLLSYYFPPQPEAGALRPSYIARYLPEFGWHVTVVTRQYGADHLDSNVIAGRDRKLLPTLPPPSSTLRLLKHIPLVAKSFAAVRSMVSFPDGAIGWLPEALKCAGAAASDRHFNAVLSSCGPPTVHLAASIMAKKLAVPWVADYRDPWSFNAYTSKGWVRQRLEYFLERHALKRAKILTCVSDGVAEALKKTHGRDDIKIIPNASDALQWDDIPNSKPTAFKFCFAGRLYAGQRNPDILFAAVRELRRQSDLAGEAICFEFYGPDNDVALTSAQRYGLTEIVKTFDTMPRETILRAQRNSAALLILLKMDARTASETGSKLLEFVGARRPVLAVGPPTSVVRDFIDAAGLGFFASNQEECAEAIRQLFYRFSNGSIENDVNPSWRPFTSRELASEFSKVLDGIT
jgi:glycosyltransferase involved in cell wall biosynthesis